MMKTTVDVTQQARTSWVEISASQKFQILQEIASLIIKNRKWLQIRLAWRNSNKRVSLSFKWHPS